MQERISSPPPEPSKREDLSAKRSKANYDAAYQFLKIMGQAEPLSQVHLLAQDLQSKELGKIRQGTPLSTSSGQVALENIQIELDSLKNMIALLDQKMKGNATVAKFKQQLNQLGASYPHLTPKDTENLNSLIGELFPFVQKMGSDKKLSQEDLGEFFKELSGMFAAVNAHNKQAMGAWEKAKDPSLSEFASVDNTLKAAHAKAQNAAFASGSLPGDFSRAILNHYMPNQEKYLMQLAEELFFSNFGTQMDTQLLNDVMGWSDASNNYDLNNWLNSNQNSDGSYKGTAASAKKHIKGEENQANGDLNKAKQAEKDIAKQLAKIKELEKEGKLTPAQAKKLTRQLDRTDDNLKQAVKNLTKLVSDLKTAYKDVKSSGKDGFTLPSADANAIQKDENTVVNGDPNAKGFGGLETIQAQLSNDQTSWSGQSQQNQIELQMRMTQIQQEWTVVSTSLQLLNQMYMTLAKSLYQ